MTSGTKWLIGSLIPAGIVLGGLIALRVFVVTPYKLPTSSMEPTVSRGAILWVYHRGCAYATAADVRRGDVIAYQFRIQDKTEVYLKRVVAVPGDHVSTSGAAVSVNGRPLAQRLVGGGPDAKIIEETNDGAAYRIEILSMPHQPQDVEIVVPAECFFVLGDNRMNSLDSRYTGCVPFKDIIGKMLQW